MSTPGCLDGRVVVVTGAGAGLGLAYALHAAAEGAAVVVNDLAPSAAEEVAARITADGGRAVPCAGGVAEAGTGEALVATALSAFGRLDGLVNNAGVRPEGTAWEEDPAAVRRCVEVNLLGTILCGAAALRQLREQGSGAVVNVSSRAQQGVPGSPTYSATKGAIASLTYSWAIDAHPFGIRVNAVAPQAGQTGTRRRGDTFDDTEPTAGQMAPLVSFLLSDRSSGVTGQVVRCGGKRDAPAVGLMTHPRNDVLFERADGWDVAALDALFRDRLAGRLAAVGAVPIPQEHAVISGGRVRLVDAPGL